MKTQHALCPSDAALSDFGLGKLDAASAETVSQHLETCDGCRQRVASLPGDSFVERLRDVGDNSKAAGQAPPKPQRTFVPGESIASVIGSSDTSQSGIRRASRAVAIEKAPPELANHPDYELMQQLGQGGMGTVYLARHRITHRLEVLKVVSKSLLDHPGAMERFQSEIRSACSLAHANIVGAYGVLHLGDMLILVMEYVKGQDMSQLVKRKGPLPIANAAFYGHQAALGLQHAHEKGMVHRDIKPNNLMLAVEGKKHIVKILDFGLAKSTSEKAANHGLTKSGQMLGTPDYVAPEQTLKANKADIRSDIYSLGCTMYFLLSGGPPFQEESLYEILQAHHTRDPRPLNLVRPEVPVELAAVVAKMMAKDPARRFQAPSEVARALLPFFKPGQSVVPAAATPAATHQRPQELAQSPIACVAPPIMRAVPLPLPIPVPPASETFSNEADDSVGRISIVHSREKKSPRRGYRRNLNQAVIVGSVLAAIAIAAVIIVKIQTHEGPGLDIAPFDAKQAKAHQDTPVVIKGNLAYEASPGQIEPDADAVAIALPFDKRPDEKLASRGLHSTDTGIIEKTPAASALHALEGACVRVGAGGAFRLVVPRPGKYFLLVISKHAKRELGRSIEFDDLRALSEYFERPADLIGGYQYDWSVRELAAAPPRFTHEFLMAQVREGTSGATEADADSDDKPPEPVDVTDTGDIATDAASSDSDDEEEGDDAETADSMDTDDTIETNEDGADPLVDIIKEAPPQTKSKARDLLDELNLQQAQRIGDWRMENGRLKVPDEPLAWIAVCRDPPEEYSLTISLECQRHEGSFNVGIIVGGRQALVGIDSTAAGTQPLHSGLWLVNDTAPAKDGTAVFRRSIDDGKRNTIVCTVQKRHVRVTCNGTKVVDRDVDAESLSLPPQAQIGRSPRGQLFVGCGGTPSPFVVTKLELIPLGRTTPKKATPSVISRAMAKLEAARVAHETAVEKQKNDLLDLIEKRVDAARTNGDNALLESLIGEREALEGFGIPPESVPAASVQKYATAMKKTSARMESAYAAAIEELAKAKQDDVAQEVRQQWITFQEQEGAALGIIPGAVWDGDATWIRTRVVANGSTVNAGYKHKVRLSISSVNGREFKGTWSWGGKPDREPDDNSRPIIGRFKNGHVEWKGDGVDNVVVPHFASIKGRQMERTSADTVGVLVLVKWK